jgi:hypothetical protein
MSLFHDYSLNNQLLIVLQCPHASKVMGLRQWNRLNRYVKKGEKGIRVLAPLVKKRLDAETQLEKGMLVGFKPVAVFDISQTDGEPLPRLETLVGGDDYAPHVDALKGYCAQQAIAVEGAALSEGHYGTSHGGRITLEQTLQPNDAFQVLVHEVAHEALHKSQQAKQQPKELKELQAESISYVVCRYFGLETKAANYLALYHADSKQIVENLEIIRKMSKELIQYLEQQLKPDDSSSPSL